MLDPRDREFLGAAVVRGMIAEGRARQLAARYQGMPGGLAAALVELRIITPHQRHALEVWLTPPPAPRPAVDSSLAGLSPPTPGTGRIGPAPAQAPAGTVGTGVRRGPYGYDSETPAPLGAPESTPVESTPRTPQTSRLLPRGTAVMPTIPGYELESELGRGGMGVVYRAKRRDDGRLVAIKLLLDVSERHQQRFRREASALQRMKHPGIVELLETGEVEGQPFIVMDYLPGGDFRVAMQRGLLDEQRALRVVAKAARAIAYAHAQNVVHRDLKPANILLDAELEPRVTDFGLARILDHESQLTRTGVAVGTPQFMAPEQVRADDPSPACDVFALGAILYVVLTGVLPFKGHGAALLTAICNDVPLPPSQVKSGVPRALSDLVLACLEKQTDARPTCLALADALDGFLDGRPVRIVPRSRVRRQRRILLGLAGCVGLGVAVGLGVSAWRASDAAKVEQALEGLRVALSEARKARGKLDREGYGREAAALRSAAAVLAAVPAAGAAEAEGQWYRAGAGERRAEVLAQLVPLLLDAREAAQATALARERREVLQDAQSDVLLGRCLALDPATADEACRLALRGARAAGPAAEVAREGALTLLRLQRPALAADALADAPASLVPLRGRARVLAGDLAGGAADLTAAVVSASRENLRDRSLVAALAEVEVRLGHAGQALERLDALRAGSGDPVLLATRARALEALGRFAAARASWADVLGLEPPRASAGEPLVCAPGLAGRGRLHLRRGRALLALADLRRAPEPAARLDAAVAAWLEGGDDGPALTAFDGVARAAREFLAPPALGAEAEGWAARVELARGRPAVAAVRAATAWSLDPSPRTAALLGLVRLRCDDPAGALAAVDALPVRTPGGDGVAALALMALGKVEQALARPAPPAWRADVERLAALKRGKAEDAAVAERAAWRLRAPERRGGGDGGRPCPVPVASEPGDEPTLDAAARLAWAARVGLATGDERVRRLLERALALDPDDVGTRALQLLAAGDAAGLRRLIEARPHLPELRRTRLLLLLSRTDETLPLPEVQADLEVLGAITALSGRERLALAKALDAAGEPARAEAMLAPLLEAPARDPEAFALGARLAGLRGDEAQQAKLEKVLRRIAKSRERAAEIREAAAVTETQLVAARDALEVWARDLPIDEDYWWKKAHYESGSTRVPWSTMAGAQYLLVARGTWAYRVTYWTYAYGYSTVATGNETPLELAAKAIEVDPRDPAPFMARAMYLLARVHKAAAESSPEDLEAAADSALHAVSLAPRSTGALALAADALCELKDGVEAEPLALAALAADPTNQYAKHQLARCAALAGDARRAVDLLSSIETPERFDVAGYQFRKDPCFQGPILDDPELRRIVDRRR